MKELLNYYKKEIEKIKPGTYVKIKYQKEIKTKNKNDKLVKISCGVYRIGINYANLIENKDKVIGELKWGSNVLDYEKYFIQHQKKNENEITYYLKVFTTKHHKTITQYVLNGEIKAKKELIEQGYLKEETPNQLLTFTIALNNIIEMGS